MKIVHIGTADNRGGAARAAFQLHEGLLRDGHDSRMLVGQKFEERPEIERIGFSKNLIGRAGTRFVLEFETLTGLQYLTTPWRKRFLRHPFTRNADIIQLHNLHGNFFSPLVLPELSQMAPLVWTLHDAWPLTGHCTYNYDCDRWQIGCGHCPNLEEHPRIVLDTTALLWRTKKRIYERSNITVVAPSKWLAAMARESPLLGRFAVHHIPYGLDLDKIKPVDRPKARQELGIPTGAVVLMIVVMPGGARKGAEYFARALPQMDLSAKPWILVAGSRGLLGTVPENFRLLELGYLESSNDMLKCYSAADIFVLPTLADNLPVSLLEANACGTPAVAFDVGGVPDIVRHMETGYLARHKDASDLAKGLDVLVGNSNLRNQMRSKVRRLIESEYAAAIQVHRYEELYRTLHEKRAAHRA